MSDETIRRELNSVEANLARLNQQVQAVEAERTRLVLLLTDSEGAHDRRFAGVR